MAEQIPRLLATILKAREDPDHKIIVFFVAARIVQVSKLFRVGLYCFCCPVCISFDVRGFTSLAGLSAWAAFDTFSLGVLGTRSLA